MPFADVLTNISKQFAALSPTRRAVLVVTGVGSLLFLFWVASGLGQPSDRLLYRGLPDDEAARVTAALREEHIPYRLGEGGSAIYVPASAVYEARIRLAGRGLPASGPGFEIFDRVGFGVTDFVHHVNYQRALQGELARSIEQLEVVQRARVQVAMPEPSPFVADRRRQPSASVVVKLHAGSELTPLQARAIVHLVASSVPGLEPARVTVVDDRGRLLAPDGGDVGQGSLPSGARLYQARLEKALARRIESILEPTVGVGRVVASVGAELDWTSIERTEERYDPDSQVERSEQRTTETSSEGAAAAEAGVPGTRSNLPGEAGAAPGPAARSSSTRTSETINYELSKTVSRTVVPQGRIKRLTVAVLVAGKPNAEGDAFQPWDEESLRKFEELAKQAVGFSSERGDRITLTSAPFQNIEIGEEEGGWLTPDTLVLLGVLARALGVVVAVLLCAKLVVQPLAGALATPSRAAALPASAAELEAQLAGGGTLPDLPAAPPTLAEQVSRVAQQRSDDSLKTIRTWLRQS